MTQDELDNDPSLPKPNIGVRLLYDARSREKIWEALLDIKASSNNALNFASNVRNVYFNCFSKSNTTKNHQGGNDLRFSIRGRTHLRKIYEEIENGKELLDFKFQDSTWRFFDIVSQLYKKQSDVELTVSIFDFYEGATYAKAIDVFSKNNNEINIYLQPKEDSCDISLLRISNIGDDYHTKVTLYVSESRRISIEQMYRQIKERNFRGVEVWNGIAKYLNSTSENSESSNLLKNRELIALLKSNNFGYPGSVHFKPQLCAPSDNYYNCKFQTPFSLVEYEAILVE